jgi:hypothetical protein
VELAIEKPQWLSVVSTDNALVVELRVFDSIVSAHTLYDRDLNDAE